jgi:hypothetical protein
MLRSKLKQPGPEVRGHQWTQYPRAGEDAWVLVPHSARTTWCSESGILVRDYDHFCPWTGTTIAGGNMCALTLLAAFVPPSCCFGCFTGGGTLVPLPQSAKLSTHLHAVAQVLLSHFRLFALRGVHLRGDGRHNRCRRGCGRSRSKTDHEWLISAIVGCSMAWLHWNYGQCLLEHSRNTNK